LVDDPYHLVYCAKAKGAHSAVIDAHHHVTDQLAKIASSCCVPYTLEPIIRNKINKEQKKRVEEVIGDAPEGCLSDEVDNGEDPSGALYADIRLNGPKHRLYVDVVRTNPTCVSYTKLSGGVARDNASETACKDAVEKAIKYKKGKYNGAVEMEQVVDGGLVNVFRAFAVTSLGGLSVDADKVLKQLAKMAIDNEVLAEANRSTALRAWRRMITCALWRGLGLIAGETRMNLAAALKWKTDETFDHACMASRGEPITRRKSLRNRLRVEGQYRIMADEVSDIDEDL
jgi:hypothetical protein